MTVPPFELVSIIVPAYNEAPSLAELYERVKKALSPQNFEFIVINDGSTDDTLAVLTRLRAEFPNITVISHFRNHGKSMALMQGFDAARGDVAATMDADLQDVPEALPQLLAKLPEGYDLVNGYRRNRNDTFSKRLVSKVFNAMVGWLFKASLHDINCGFKAFSRACYKNLQLRGDLHRLIPLLAIFSGFKVTEVEVPHAERKYGISRFHLLRYRGLLDIVSLSASRTTQIRPFHIFSELAILAFLSGTGIFTAWIRWFSGRIPDSFLGRCRYYYTGLLGILFILLGTILPLVGFVLDILSIPTQGPEWRKMLIKEKILADVSR